MDPRAVAYAEEYSSREETLLQELSAFTHTYHPDPGMLSGSVQGIFLKMISRMLRPHNVLEIGTLSGYSALCLAEGLAEGGELHTIECRERDVLIAREFVARSAFAGRISVHQGEALAIIETLKRPWDLVYIDADKINYVNYYEAVFRELVPGGFILIDNVLFHGQVLEEPVRGKNAKAIQAFNEHIRNDTRIESVLLTIRDGIMLVRKK
jgi:predicted O-methyltransferase YrrM